jgi:hypothetical protein
MKVKNYIIIILFAFNILLNYTNIYSQGIEIVPVPKYLQIELKKIPVNDGTQLLFRLSLNLNADTDMPNDIVEWYYESNNELICAGYPSRDMYDYNLKKNVYRSNCSKTDVKGGYIGIKARINRSGTFSQFSEIRNYTANNIKPIISRINGKSEFVYDTNNESILIEGKHLKGSNIFVNVTTKDINGSYSSRAFFCLSSDNKTNIRVEYINEFDFKCRIEVNKYLKSDFVDISLTARFSTDYNYSDDTLQNLTIPVIKNLSEMNYSPQWKIVGSGTIGKANVIYLYDTFLGKNQIWFLDEKGEYYKTIPLPQTGKNWKVKNLFDINNDGNSDIIWSNKITGENAIWLLNSNGIIEKGINLPNTGVNSNWNIIGVNNYDNDKQGEILWRDQVNGDTHIWKLKNNFEYKESKILPNAKGWELVFTKDMNNDGIGDLIWRNKLTGENHIWPMNSNFTKQNSIILPSVPYGSKWYLAGAGDFDKDKTQDLLWRNTASGQTGIWKLNKDLNFNFSKLLTDVLEMNYKNGTNYGLRVMNINDFNNDGYDDILWSQYAGEKTEIWSINPKLARNYSITDLPKVTGGLNINYDDQNSDYYFNQ